MAKTTAAKPVDTPELRAHLLTLIQSTAEPVTASQVAKLLVAPWKLSEARLTPILEELVAAQSLRPFPAKTAKGKGRYWDRDEVELGCLLIDGLLAKKGPQSLADLRKAAKQVTEEAFQAAFQKRIAGNQLFEYPTPPKKKTVFGSQPPSPEPYLRDIGVQLTKIVAQLIAAKVPPAALRRALLEILDATGVAGVSAPAASTATTKPEISTQPPLVDLVSLMRIIEPAADNGALVPARELRRVANLEKNSFDQAVLGLARQGRLMLHRHDFASGLSDAERQELVTDGAGTYYVGMALRRDLA